MSELYKEVINLSYQEKMKGERVDIRNLKNELEQENTRLSKARDLLLASEIDPSDYRTIKATCEKKITTLEAKLFNPNKQDNNIEKLLEKAIETIANLVELYECGDIKMKRKIIGSIFPKI